MNRSFAVPVLAVALFFQFGCGGEESPTVITKVTETPTPVATAAPTAAPAPSSGLCPNGNMPVAAFDIKIFSVKKPNGELRDFEPSGPFYVGEQVRLDSQGKDRFGRRTDGCTEPRWSWEPDEVGMLNGDKGWNPWIRVLSEGAFLVTASHDDIEAREGWLKLEFLPKAAAPYHNQ